MKKVTIPFRPQFEVSMIKGLKTATSRSKRYGYSGDYFEAFGRIFILTNVRFIRLDFIAHVYFRDEGLESPNGFISIWRRLHPRKLYDPRQRVYFHQFKLQSELLPPFHIHEFYEGRCSICGWAPAPVDIQGAFPLKK